MRVKSVVIGETLIHILHVSEEQKVKVFEYEHLLFVILP